MSLRSRFLASITLGCLSLLLAASLEAQQIQVTSADPASAEQGTVNLNVSIKGKNFKKGAISSFVLSGTSNPDGIAVNGTTFVSASELTANITIADTATVAKFDVVVKNSDGRIGKGTELFAVLAKGSSQPLPEIPVVSTIEGTGILSDATVPNYRLQSDFTGDYENGVDRVVSHMQGGGIGTGAGDYEMYTTDSTVRKITVDLREPYDASATPPFPYATVPGRVLVQCHLVSPASINGMHGLNTTLVCPMIVNFYAPGDRRQYRLLMGSGIPYTNDALVTCTEVSGSATDPNAPCIAWTVDPSVIDASGPRNVARMQHALPGGKFEERGKFYLRFHISFRK